MTNMMRIHVSGALPPLSNFAVTAIFSVLTTDSFPHYPGHDLTKSYFLDHNFLKKPQDGIATYVHVG